MGKGENAGKQHFLLFPQCFRSFSNQISIVWLYLFSCLQMFSIWTNLKLCCLVKELSIVLVISQRQLLLFSSFLCFTLLHHSDLKPWERSLLKNMLVKDVGNQHFHLFPQCFLSYHRQILPFKPHQYYLQMLQFRQC